MSGPGIGPWVVGSADHSPEYNVSNILTRSKARITGRDTSKSKERDMCQMMYELFSFLPFLFVWEVGSFSRPHLLSVLAPGMATKIAQEYALLGDKVLSVTLFCC